VKAQFRRNQLALPGLPPGQDDRAGSPVESDEREVREGNADLQRLRQLLPRPPRWCPSWLHDPPAICRWPRRRDSSVRRAHARGGMGPRDLC